MAKFYRSEDRTVLFELFGAGTSVGGEQQISISGGDILEQNTKKWCRQLWSLDHSCDTICV